MCVFSIKLKLAWLSRSMVFPLGTFPWLSLSVILPKTSLKRLDSDNPGNISRLITNLGIQCVFLDFVLSSLCRYFVWMCDIELHVNELLWRLERVVEAQEHVVVLLVQGYKFWHLRRCCRSSPTMFSTARLFSGLIQTQSTKTKP
jgi:hypothetical protein